MSIKYQVASTRYSLPKALILVLTGLLLPLLACGSINPQDQYNNQVRLAVYQYERAKRGPVDELLLHFNQNESRINFEGQDQNGGRTVWLPTINAEEYFAVRSPQRTYLYIQDINYSEDKTKATIKVYRGDGASYRGWELRLTREQDQRWQVTTEVELEAKSSP